MCWSLPVEGLAGAGVLSEDDSSVGYRTSAQWEILIRLWPGPAAEDKLIARQSGFGRMLAGEPPPPSGRAARLGLGETVPMPVSYHRFYLRDEGVPAPWEQETLELSAARVNGLVSNLPGLAEVSTGTAAGEVDLCARVVDRHPATVTDALTAVAGPGGLPATTDAVAVTHRTAGAVLVTDLKDYADHYRLSVPAGEVGLLVVAWDRDQAVQRRRNTKSRERIDLVFWAGETPGRGASRPLFWSHVNPCRFRPGRLTAFTF